MYEGDGHGQTVRKLALADGMATTVAGVYGDSGFADGVVGTSRVTQIRHMSLQGSAYVFMSAGNRIARYRKSDTFWESYACPINTGNVDGPRMSAECILQDGQVVFRSNDDGYFFCMNAAMIKRLTSTDVWTVGGRGFTGSFLAGEFTTAWNIQRSGVDGQVIYRQRRKLTSSPARQQGSAPRTAPRGPPCSQASPE